MSTPNNIISSEPVGEICQYTVTLDTANSLNNSATVSYVNSNNLITTIFLDSNRPRSNISAKRNTVGSNGGNIIIDLIGCSGNDTTAPSTTPSITLTSPSNPTRNSFEVNGSIYTPNVEIIDAAVVASLNANPPTDSPLRLTLGKSNTFTGRLSGLQSNTTYYVRAYIQTAGGYFFSDEFQIKTSSVINLRASVPNPTTFSFSGGITGIDLNSIFESGIVASLTPNPDRTSTIKSSLNRSVSGEFQATLTNLTPGTVYYVRAYLRAPIAVAGGTSDGTVFSNEIRITTTPLRTPPPPPPDLNELTINVTGPSNSLSFFNETDNVNIGLVPGRNKYSYQGIKKFTLKSANLNKFKLSEIKIKSKDENRDIKADVGNSLSYSLKLDTTVIIDVTVDSVIPTTTPKISLRSSNSVLYNIKSDDKIFVKLGINQRTDRLAVYINNRSFNVDIRNKIKKDGSYTLEIDPKQYLTSLGTYKVTIIPFNSDGAGQNVELVINTISTYQVSTPDLRDIKYPSKLRGPDFVGFNVNFDVSWVGINTSYVNLYYGNSETKFIRVSNNKITLNVKEVIDNLKGDSSLVEYSDRVEFLLRLVPFNSVSGEVLRGKAEVVKISFDKRFLTIPRNVAIERIFEGFEFQLDTSTEVFRDETSNFLTHILHLGNGSAKIISNWVGDPTDNSVILKLYEPLPSEVQLNQKAWISKLQSNPIIEIITMTGDDTLDCQLLRGPNFSVDIDNGIGFRNYESLVASGSLTSQNLINRFAQKNNIDLNNLNIEYVSDDEYLFQNFVHFGSSEELVNNFVYKLKLTEEYDSRIESLKSGGNWTTILSLKNDIDKYDILKNEIIKNFNGFEYFLYNDTSTLAYPKNNGELLHTTSSQSISWYNNIILLSSEYDKDNPNYLVNNIPDYIVKDQENSDFILFLDMIGTHFDIIWSYINGVTRLKKLNENKLKGITDKLVFQMLETLGWDAKRPFDTYLLWEYGFGLNKDGSSKFNKPLEEATNEVWRRILNNLPYLLKHKGTSRSLKAIMACYGVPQSLLTIMEFGGPNDPTLGGTKKFSFDDRTASVVFRSGSQINVGWNQYTPTLDYPNGVEFRIDTTDKVQHILINNPGNWSLELTPTNSSFGKLDFYVSSSGTLYSSSTSPFALFTDDYEQILINRTTDGVGELFEVYGVNTEGDRIVQTVSSSLYIPSTTNWSNGSTISIGPSYSGKLDEFRLWTIPLQVARLQEHALFPDSISGNSFTASTSDLIFRLDFERPQDLNVNPNINNVSINRLYGEDNATTQNFYTAESYPFQYFPYERTVTATVPSLGFNYSDKIRFETQYTLRGTEITPDMNEVVDLSHISRATQRQFDRAPVDSNRLGIFFSPIKELNMDILKTFGDFNIDNLIGNPSDEYSDRYRELDKLRGYYFQRLDRNLNEYIQLVRYIDKSLFDVLSDLAPARAKISKGLLIEPHFLERSKIAWKRPTAQQNGYIVGINVEDLIFTEAQFESRLYVIDAGSDVVFNVDISNLKGLIKQKDTTSLTATLPFYKGLVEYNVNDIITIEIPTYEGNIVFEFGERLLFEYENSTLTVIGFNPDSLSEAGYGIYSPDGFGLISKYDKLGKLNRNRRQVFVTTENNPIFELNVSGSESFLIKRDRFTKKVTLTPIDGGIPIVSGKIVSVQLVDGYLPTHYKFVNSLTAGLRNSFFNGAKQTINTTPDGLPPVEVFTTNPNVLRVTDTGRGSGEPILIVT
jgi:hypothetical protein